MRKKRIIRVSLIASAALLILAALFSFYIYKRNRDKTNLANLYELTAKDPLFYSPFFDKEGLTQAIGGLEKSEERLKKIVLKNIELNPIGPKDDSTVKDRYLSATKKTKLFPYEFLSELISINSKTAEFLKDPSIRLGKNLLDDYDNAADFYIQSVRALLEASAQDEADKTLSSYFFFAGSVSSAKTARDDLSTIEKNGYALKEEIKKRRDCLAGRVPCPAPPNGQGGRTITDSLNAEFNLSGKKITFIKNNLPISAPDKIKGPYKISSACWGESDTDHWLYLLYKEAGGKLSIIPKLADQNYYYKVSSPAKNKTDRILSDKNLPFNLQPEANTYECTNLTFYPELLTLDFLKNKIDSGLIAADDLPEDPDYRLLIKNQFGLMAPAINTVSDHLNTLSLHLSTNQSYLPPDYLFLLRSSYSLFYFPFAESIWRIDEQPQYFTSEKEKPLGKSGDRFKTFDDLIQLGYTQKEISNFNINLGEILETLPENQSLD